MVADEYIFQITHMGITHIATPVNDDFTIDWEQEEEEVFLRKVLSTEFFFCDKADFDFLYAIEESCDRCLLVKFDIICRIDNSIVFEGYLNLNKGKWNPCFCEVALKPESNDEYTCFYNKCNEEKNILENTPKNTVSQFIGDIQCQTCTQFIPTIFIGDPMVTGAVCDPVLSTADGWTVTYNKIEQLATEFGINTTITTRYCREFYFGTVQPPGNDWVPVAGGFARPVLANFTNEVFTNLGQNHFCREFNFTVSGYVFAGTDEDGNPTEPYVYEYDNGVKLEDVLNLWLLYCGLPIKSNFFGINADGTAPTNQAYSFAAANYQNLIIYQITDIINADASENANIGKTTIKKLLEALRCLNVYWKIVDGKFCLEHHSYFEQTTGIVSIENDPCIDKLENYTYTDDSVPQFEKFSWLYDASPYFEGDDITYTGFCVDFGEEKEHDCEVYTDLGTAISELEDNSLGLFFLSAVEFNGSLYVNDNNNPLSFTEIHENLFLWNRCQSQGTINGNPTTFLSYKRIKEQEPLTIDMCCDEIESFDASQLIKSQLGWGKIKSASFSAKGKCITIRLLHNQNC